MNKKILLLLLIFSIPFAHAEKIKGIKWEKNLEKALETAKGSNQLLILDFYADWCPPCNEMEQITYADSRVIEQLKTYIPVKIDIDKKQKLANKYDGNAKANGGSGIPATIILDSNGTQLAKIHGFRTPEELLELLKKAESERSK